MSAPRLTCLALLLLCAGCPGGGGEQTPDACYAAILQAAQARDFKAFYYAHDPESRTALLLDEQLMAEQRARRERKLEDYEALEAKLGVGEYVASRGTPIHEQIYESLSERNRAAAYEAFVSFLTETPEPRGFDAFGELQGPLEVSGDTATGIVITYPKAFDMPADYATLEPSAQEALDMAKRDHDAYYAGKHQEHHLKLVRRGGAWYFAEFEAMHTVDEDD